MNKIRGSLIITLVAALTVVAAFTASTAAAGSMAKYPPCTQKALTAGLKNGSAQPKGAIFEKPFACASGWAYSGVIVGGKKNGVEATAVYKAKNGAWTTVDRAKPCNTHAIPKKIYKGACATN
jgi:hypothetical protein